MTLLAKKCIPCEGGIPPLTKQQAEQYLEELNAWDLFDTYITKTFAFKDFARSIEFVNRVAEIAEAEGHHPDITITYNKVTLTLMTHSIAGLSENDFILAAKIDATTA